MSKTRMSGAYGAYLEMFKKIMFWDISPTDVKKYENKKYKTSDNQDCDELYGLGWAMGDLPFHGWSGEAAENEFEIYHKVKTAYSYLMKVLAEAIDFEDMDNDMWKYVFKNIDTNDLLKLYQKNKDKA